MSQFVDDHVAMLNEKLNGGGLAKSIALEIKDEGRIVIDDTGAKASDDATKCTVILNAETFTGLLGGTVNPTTALMLGKIKVKGDMTAAMQLSAITD
ncbi:SCP2 sterol-binding domain-containing protein [Actibacterium sp. D379-3]